MKIALIAAGLVLGCFFLLGYHFGPDIFAWLVDFGQGC